jgi:putative addiction module component (TIGR02574 family)
MNSFSITDISPELKAELDSRLQEFEANPEAGYSWEEVKAQIKDGTWRKISQKQA